MKPHALLVAGVVALVLGLAGCSAAAVLGGSAIGGTMMGGGMMRNDMMGGMTEPMMVWQQGSGPIASPQPAAQLGLAAAKAHGWTWLTVDEVHIFPSFYEVEFNDQGGFKGPEIYVNRSSGSSGPEMGPNMVWDTRYGMGGGCNTEMQQGDARALAIRATSLTLGDGERHHGYWEFEVKRGSAVVNQVNVNDCTHSVIAEQMWQPDMEGTFAPNG